MTMCNCMNIVRMIKFLDHLRISWRKSHEIAVKTNRMDIRYLHGYKFVCPDKTNPKEACDVRTQYSTLFPLSSNQNCRSNGYPRGNPGSYPCGTRQTLSTHLSWMRSKSLRSSQLDSEKNPGYFA